MTEELLSIASIEPFRQWLLGQGRSTNTVRAYCSDVRMLFQACPTSSFPKEQLSSLVADWLNRTKREMQPATSRRRMAALREFSEWSGQERILPKYSLPTMGQAYPHPLPGLLSDLIALQNECKTNNQRALIGLLGYEGLRLHEALAITPSDFRLSPDGSDDRLDVWGKGSKLRTIPITKRAWDVISPQYVEALACGRDTVIVFSDRGARNFITELGRRARLSREISSHDLRATCATLLYQTSGNNIELVRKWLGHAHIQTTTGYVGTSMDEMRQGGNF